MSSSTEVHTLAVSAPTSRLESEGGAIVGPENNETNSIKTARLTIIAALFLAVIATLVIRLVIHG
jgi:hypothetical protein